MICFKRFQSGAARRIAEEILSSNLAKVKYDPEQAPEMSKKIANQILAAIKSKVWVFFKQILFETLTYNTKELDLDRYKIAVDVTIGEFKGQGIRVASRALWDTSTDSYASASYKNVRVQISSVSTYIYILNTRRLFLLWQLYSVAISNKTLVNFYRQFQGKG